MTAIALTEPSLLNAKRALRQCFVEEKSTHLTEALAAACGFASHAALLAAVRQMNPDDPDYVRLSDAAFIRRMNELIELPMEDDPGLFELLSYPSKGGVIETEKSGTHTVYNATSKRVCVPDSLTRRALHSRIR